MNTDLPSFTIVTPSYNQGAFLEEAIASVLDQNYPRLQYIVLDGGSSDNSLQIIKRYAPHLAHWRSAADAGQAAAVAEGFRLATGDVLAWLNSDDRYAPGALWRVAELYAANPDADVYYGNVRVVSAVGFDIGERRLAGCPSTIVRAGLKHGGFGIYQPAAFWRKATYLEVGGLDESLQFAMDTDLFFKFGMRQATKFVFTREPLVYFRVHANAKTATLQPTARREFGELLYRYGLARNSIWSQIIRTLVRGIRIVYYIRQGDLVFLIKHISMGRRHSF